MILLRNSRFSDNENRNVNINDSENNNIITNNVMNSSIGENRVNLSNFLNNESVNIYVMWYILYNFLIDGRDADIIDLNYKKEYYGMFYLRTKSFQGIILKRHS